jgi:hypothetical protein
MAAPLDQPFILKSGVTFRPLETGGLLVDLATGECWEVNPTGATLWNRLVGGQTLREAIEGLQEEYDVVREAVEQDAVRLCSDLVAAGLLGTSPVTKASP